MTRVTAKSNQKCSVLWGYMLLNTDIKDPTQMHSVTFFNNKGGVGKTTLLCNLAAWISLCTPKKVCVVDADPQCNATQYFFNEEVVENLYSNDSSFTIFKVIEPLSLGEGYNQDISVMRAGRFNLDVLPGDPRLALTEDLLSKDWGDARAGEVRGVRTSLVFSELLNKLHRYDYVFFDVSPSLGALNRSIMLSSDYFISPVSLDIFSLKAFENIARWIDDWWNDWQRAIENVKRKESVPNLKYGRPEFIGYVTQQYLAKRDSHGQRRAVQAYETIRSQIDDVITDSRLSTRIDSQDYEIGTVPNLFSLVPMSQSNHTPIFGLNAADGVVGAHFSKVKEAKDIFETVGRRFLERTAQ